jgi:tRNA(Ile)-lysidine synthase
MPSGLKGGATILPRPAVQLIAQPTQSTDRSSLTGPIFAELNRLKVAFGPRFIIGLSGGGDSMALAHLCAAWTKQSDAQVSALIVDHGLRAQASVEAQQALAWAEALGLPATIHTYNGPRFTTRIQEKARNLRHDAFQKAVADAGGATILLGHTLDDQAETIAFRLSRQTGLDGLAGMASVTKDVLAGVPIARPLLGLRREALRDYLREMGQDWVEDPSNENQTFARVRVRQQLSALGGVERLARIGTYAQILRDHQNEAADILSQRCGLKADDNLTAFQLDPFLAAPEVIQLRMLGQLFPAKSPINPEKLMRLLVALRVPSFKSATLAGRLIRRRGDSFFISKAPPRTHSQ